MDTPTLYSHDHSSGVEAALLVEQQLPPPRTQRAARLGLESRLGGVGAVGAGGVDGLRVDEHVRVVVAARQEHHLAGPSSSS